MSRRSISFFVISLFCLELTFFNLVYAQTPPKSSPKSSKDSVNNPVKNLPTTYRRQNIAQARFGDQALQALRTKALSFSETTKKTVIGQDPAIHAIEAKVLEYLYGYGHHQGAPVTKTLIGFPGIGKSAIAEGLSKILPTQKVDAQLFSDAKDTEKLLQAFSTQTLSEGQPGLLLIEEIDKVREIYPGEKPTTTPIIGALNQILDKGKYAHIGSWLARTIDLQNKLVIITLNLPEEIITEFSVKVLGELKDFHLFTISDFKKFEQWLSSDPASIPQVLSKMFRSNTVSRLSQNVSIVNHLNEENYRTIIASTLEEQIKAVQERENGKLAVSIVVEDSFKDFLFEHAVIPSQGARGTVLKAKSLFNQLIHYGIQSVLANDTKSLERPRQITIGFDRNTQQAQLKIESYKKRGKSLVLDSSAEIKSEYSPSMGVFFRVQNLAMTPPPSTNRIAPVTKREVRTKRRPKTQNFTPGLAREISKSVFDQDETADYIQEKVNEYLIVDGKTKREPKSVVLAGFTGIGKSQIIHTTAEILDIPVVRINLQNFSSDSDDAPGKLIAAIADEIEKAKIHPNFRGKYFVVLEELDKIKEIAENGMMVNRPAITVVKDLLDQGIAKFTQKREFGGNESLEVDLRDALLFVTMNLEGDLFKFKAHPILTTYEDLFNVYQHVAGSFQDIRHVLERIFRADTINRLLSHIHLMKPLTEEGFRKVLTQLLETTLEEMFYDEDGRDLGKLKVRLSKKYLDFLLKDIVIPSEGARHTKNEGRKVFVELLTQMREAIPKENLSDPIEVFVDFDPKTLSVKTTLKLKGSKKLIATSQFEVDPNFYTVALSAQNSIPYNRYKVAAHEFGHAFVAVWLGARFNQISVTPVDSHVEGIVTHKSTLSDDTAKSRIADIFISLGSIVFERLLLSQDPQNPVSTFETGTGFDGDIENVTQKIYKFLHQKGLNPFGGFLDRQGGGVSKPDKYVDFTELSKEEIKKLSDITSQMRDWLLVQMVRSFDTKWFKEKVVELARAGTINEKVFYQILSWPTPGEDNIHLGIQPEVLPNTHIDFGSETEATRIAKQSQHGNLLKTPHENLQDATLAFYKILEQAYGSSQTPHITLPFSRCEAELF